MLDTLKLKLDVSPSDVVIDARWRTVAPLEDGAGNICAKVFDVRRSGCADKRVSAAFYNDKQTGLKIDVKPDGAWLEFSLPRYANGSNFEPVGYDGAVAALSEVGDKLGALGVRCNLNAASISRIDTFRNAETDYAWGAYNPLFDLLRLPRAKETDYGSTRLFKNSRQQFCIYDKIAEMTRKKFETDGLPRNVIRFEQRLLKPEKVRDTLGFHTLSDLLSDYGALPRVYNDTLRSIFRYDVPEIERLAADELERRLEYFESKGGNWVARSLEAFGAAWLLQRMDADTIALVYGRKAGRMAKSRTLVKLRDSEFALAMSGTKETAPVSLATLYAGLKSQLLPPLKLAA